MKRFWATATAEPDEGGWSVKLDGKPMRLPGGQTLRIATRPLAEALAAEWAAAGDGPGGTMDYTHVPLTRLAGTAQERVAAVADGVVAELARYGENDLLCYRALEPPDLVAAEAAAWDPWIDWAATTYGARMTVVQGVVAVRQPDAAVDALTSAVAAVDVNTLAGLGVIVPALGSLVLGLAVAAGAITAADAHATSIVDELSQAALWGEDDEAVAARRSAERDVADAARFIELARAR